MKQVWCIKMGLNETCSKVHIGKHLSHNFRIQNSIKQRDALSPGEVGLKLNGTHQILAYAYDVNLLEDNIGTVKKTWFDNVSQFKYLGTAVTNQSLIHKDIKRRLNSSNAFYHPVQNLMSSCLLYKTIKNRIYTTTILPVVLYGCET
jgi:hypothetical protein